MSRDKQISEMPERNCQMFSSKEEYEAYQIKLLKRQVAEEIFAEIEKETEIGRIMNACAIVSLDSLAELKKKYTEEV